MKGFTLIEITIVVAITIALLVVTIPAVVRFLSYQTLQDTQTTLVATLRQAHTNALYQKNDSAFGVRFLSGSYVLFQGSSYAARSAAYDITTTVPAGVSVSGITEVVFTKRTGVPSTTGAILLQSGTRSLSVIINQQGSIESL